MSSPTTAAWHPLDPLTPAEITAVCLALRKHIATQTDIKALKFITCYLLPPPKKTVLAFLGIPLAPGKKPDGPIPIVRKAEVDIIDLVNGGDVGWTLDTFDLLEEGIQPQISIEELVNCDKVVRNDPRVQQFARTLVRVTPEEIHCEGWSIGFDSASPHKQRLQQGLLFARFSRHDNLYAHSDVNTPVLSDHETQLAQAQRARIPPPRRAFDFLPDLMATTQEGFKLREDVKPLHITQPEGLEWQNWRMHVGFNHREGLALSTITYKRPRRGAPRCCTGCRLRRWSSRMRRPEHPHPRKFAFDSGEYGMGVMANELSLGCPGTFVKHDGTPHAGRSQTVRRRRLVVSMVCTLANYEYIFNYLFYQDGSIEMEIRLTGILQVYVAADEEKSPYGTVVAPNINAHYHQHITDIAPSAHPTGSAENFAGNAFTATDTVLTRASARTYEPDTERRLAHRNPRAAALQHGEGRGVRARRQGRGGAADGAPRRVGRAARTVCDAAGVGVPRRGERERRADVAAGKYVPQTREAPEDSIGEWVKGGESIEGEDILVYLTVGVTHIPRPEDWPVMPVEHLNITFKPVSFFEANPSMDVPGVRTPTDPQTCH
ncbi:copper amine oxidase [Mycena olivaceomarginata]|nr:copper amine oxidase [Mycena olivaceomarginata]